jgi:hypothetical protein
VVRRRASPEASPLGGAADRPTSTDEWTRSTIVDRLAQVPGNTPGMCCCAVTEGFGSCEIASAVACVRRSNEPIPRSGERSAEIVAR